MVTLVFETTAAVVAEKAAEVAPAGTVTDAGTVAAAVFELVSVTTAPPVGAGPFNVTVAAEEAVPAALMGSSTSA